MTLVVPVWDESDVGEWLPEYHCSKGLGRRSVHRRRRHSAAL